MGNRVTVFFNDGTHLSFENTRICRLTDENPDVLQIVTNPEKPVAIFAPLCSIKYFEYTEVEVDG